MSEPARNSASTATLAPWIIAGSAAAVASALVLGLCGRIENGRAAGPVNGPSQWIWGRSAAHARELSFRHTAIGYVIHHLSSLFWAGVHEHLHRHQPPPPLHADLLRGVTTAALAAFVDYRLTPRRFRPGFEQQLSRPSLVLVYAVFGVTLALARRRCAPAAGSADSNR